MNELNFLNQNPYKNYLPKEVRLLIRQQIITGQTSGMCNGYAQGNLCVLPKKYAYDFLLFSLRNQQSCPLLEVSDAGSRFLKTCAKDADIARDIPKYRVWEKGVLKGEYNDVSEFWRDDLVSFVIGCSFSFESLLIQSGIDVRNISENHNVPMYITNIDTNPAGIFSGKMVVSMRPIPANQISQAVKITARVPKVHGAPIHIGEPSLIGIKDVNKPDFGEPSTIRPGEIPVFWCCGVTPQSVVMNSKPDFCITHSPGHMLITDIKEIEFQN